MCMSVAGTNAKWHPGLSALNLSAYLETVAIEDFWWNPENEETPPPPENGMYYSPIILLTH